MTREQNEEPPSEEITDVTQEELAPANGPPEDAHTVPAPVEVEASLLEPTPPPELVAPKEDTQEDLTPPAPTTQPPAPTPQPDHPATTPDPETILDILEED